MDEASTETALLEWATGADERIKDLREQIAHMHNVMCALLIIMFFHCVNACLFSKQKHPVKRYRH